MFRFTTLLLARKTLVFILITIFLGSCSIEKRRYNEGYNINWRIHSNIFAKNNHKNRKLTAVQEFNTSLENNNLTPSKLFNEESKSNNLASTSNTNSFVNISTDLQKSNESRIRNKNYWPKLNNKKLQKKIEQILKSSKNTNLDNPDETGESKLANPALIFGILSFLFPLLFALFPVSLLAILSILSALLALIFGSIAKSDIKDNPKLTGKRKARFAFVTGITFLSLYLVALIFLIIFITLIYGNFTV